MMTPIPWFQSYYNLCQYHTIWALYDEDLKLRSRNKNIEWSDAFCGHSEFLNIHSLNLLSSLGTISATISILGNQIVLFGKIKNFKVIWCQPVSGSLWDQRDGWTRSSESPAGKSQTSQRPEEYWFGMILFEFENDFIWVWVALSFFGINSSAIVQKHTVPAPIH